MNSKILISLSVIGVVAAIAIGGTYAYFSKSMTVQGNTFSAATMTMKLNNKEEATVGPALYAKNFYPGSFAQSAAIISAGDVALNPELTLANANDPNNMADYLWLEIWTNGKLWYRNPIKQFPGYTTGKLVLDKIDSNSNEKVAFRIIMTEDAPNELQGANYSVNVVVTGHQWNDPNYQPSAPAETNATGYVVTDWSYDVCGVRQPNFWTPLLATDTYVGRGYDATKYSPFFSYRVDSPMENTNSKWRIQTPGTTSYAGGETVVTGPEVGEVYCTVK